MSKLKRVYPGNARITLDGGLSSKYSKELIPENESPDCANVVFTNGAVSTREGTSKHNTGLVGSFAMDGIFTRHDNDSSQTMVVCGGGDMFYLSGTTFVTIPSAQSQYTAGQRFGAAEYENYIFFGNGGDGSTGGYKWNGAEYTKHGIPAPVTAATADSAGTGAALVGGGLYSYKTTYINSNLVESDLGPISNTFTVSSSSGNVNLTNIPVAPTSYGVNQRYLYRTESNGSTFKRLATLTNNTDTTYEDGIADDALGVPGPTDNGVPPQYDAIQYHQNRMFMNDTSQPNLVWYSELANPYNVQSTSFIRIGDKSGEIVRGFNAFDNSIVCFTDTGQWLIYMASTTVTDWRVIKVRSSYGSKSPRGSVIYNNKVLFPAMQNDKFVGFAAISGDSVDPSATLLTVSAAGSDLKSDRIEPDMFLIQESYIKNIEGIVFKNKAYFCVSYGTGQATNNRIYVYDFSISNLGRKNPAWVPWTGLNANGFTIYDGDLYYADSSANGFIYKMEDGTYNDDSAAINSYYWTKEFSGFKGEEHLFKNFRKCHVLHENSGSYFMDLKYRADSDAGEGNTVRIDLDAGSANWGTMVYGSDVWGGGSNDDEVRLTLGKTTGKRIQFKLTNQNVADQKFSVKGLRYEYDIRGRR